MNVHEYIMSTTGKQMSNHIDFEVLSDVLIDACGWTKIELANKFLPVSGEELHAWRTKNIKGRWVAHNAVWLFEKSEDANWFSLRWL